MNLLTLLRELRTRNRLNLIAALIIGLGIVVAGYLLIRTQAAGYLQSFEPEQGNLSGTAQVVADSSASAGKSLKFCKDPVMPSSAAVWQPSELPTAETTGWQHTCVNLKPFWNKGMNINISHADLVAHGITNDTLDGYDFQGTFNIVSSGITITRSRFTGDMCTDANGCHVIDGYNRDETGQWVKNLTLKDIEITKNPASSADYIDRAVVLPAYSTLSGSYIHGTNRGILVTVHDKDPINHITIERNYIDEFNMNPPEGAHTAALTIRGAQYVTVRHNSIGIPNNGQTSAGMPIYDSQDANAINSGYIVVDNNLFDGGSYCINDSPGFVPGSHTPAPGMAFTNNYFGVKYSPKCGDYGVWQGVDATALSTQTFTNNIWYAPGDPKNATAVPQM